MEGLAQKTALVSLSQIPLSEGESEEVGKGGTLQASRKSIYLKFIINKSAFDFMSRGPYSTPSSYPIMTPVMF